MNYRINNQTHSSWSVGKIEKTTCDVHNNQCMNLIFAAKIPLESLHPMRRTCHWCRHPNDLIKVGYWNHICIGKYDSGVFGAET